jgi:hypothetical protein
VNDFRQFLIPNCIDKRTLSNDPEQFWQIMRGAGAVDPALDIPQCENMIPDMKSARAGSAARLPF